MLVLLPEIKGRRVTRPLVSALRRARCLHRQTIHTTGPRIMHARIQAITLPSLEPFLLMKKHALSRSASTQMTTAATTAGGNGGAEIAAHCDASALPSPACVPLGHLLGSAAPTGQKKLKGQTLQLDCVRFEQSDEYVPAAHA